MKFLKKYQLEATSPANKAKEKLLSSCGNQADKKIAAELFDQAFAPKFFGSFCYSRPSFSQEKLAEVTNKINTQLNLDPV